MNKTQRQSGIAHIVLILVIAAVVAGGGYYLYTKQQGSVVVSPSPTAKVSASPSPSAVSSDWRIYTNVGWNLSFEYPSKGFVKIGNENVILVEPSEKTAWTGLDVPTNPDIYDLNASYAIAISKIGPVGPFSSIQEFLNQQSHAYGDAKVTFTLLNIGNYDFYHRVADLPGTAGDQYVMLHNGVGYSIEAGLIRSSTGLSQQTILMHILSTFKFTK